MNQVINYGPYALVTGASRGIGREIALLLAKDGYNLIIVARNLDKLKALQNELILGYGVEVIIFNLDLSELNSLYILFEKTKEYNIGLIVPNAGDINIGNFGRFIRPKSENILSLNILHPTVLTELFVKRFLKREKSAVLLLVSTFGFQGVPFFSTYAASKAYILSFGESLNQELKPHGIDVTILSPGLTVTDMSKNLPINFNKLPLIPSNSQDVAKQGLAALGRKRIVVPGLINKIFIFFNRFVPRFIPVWLFGKLIKNAFIKDKTQENLI